MKKKTLSPGNTKEAVAEFCDGLFGVLTAGFYVRLFMIGVLIYDYLSHNFAFAVADNHSVDTGRYRAKIDHHFL